MTILTIIGFGNIAHSILKNLRSNNQLQITIISRSISRPVDLTDRYTYIPITGDIEAEINHSNIIILAIKPLTAKEVCLQIRDYLTDETIILSLCAGININKLHLWLPKVKIVRLMMNILIEKSNGIVSVLSDQRINDTDWEIIKSIFPSLSLCEVSNDKDIDRDTAVIGCGPAFLTQLIDSSVKTITKLGYSEKKSKDLVINMLKEVIVLYDKEGDNIITRVASKGGATEHGIRSFRENKGEEIIFAMFDHALKRITEISNLIE